MSQVTPICSPQMMTLVLLLYKSYRTFIGVEDKIDKNRILTKVLAFSIIDWIITCWHYWSRTSTSNDEYNRDD